MKIIILSIALFFVTSSLSYGQAVFGVSPGIGLNSAYFGYKIGDKIVPYFGFQYLNANFSYEEKGKRYDYDLYRFVSYSEKDEFSGNLYIPNIGIKYFLKRHNNIQAYLSLNFSKPFLSGKYSYDGEEDETFNNGIKNISMYGGEFGFGVEYFFDENFSLGGAFGLRHLHLKYEANTDSYVYNPDSGDEVNVTIEEKFKFNMSPTFSQVSLNYYF